MKIKSIRPTYNRIITTANKYEETTKTAGGIIDVKKLEGEYKEYQTVVRVGNAVREVKEGDVVLIDPSRYVRKKYDPNSIKEDMGANPIISIEIPTVQMNDEDYFLITDNDILYVIEDFEEGAEDFQFDSPTEEPKLILPKEPKINLNLK